MRKTGLSYLFLKKGIVWTESEKHKPLEGGAQEGRKFKIVEKKRRSIKI